MLVKELTYIFYPGRALVFEMERPKMPSAAFIHVIGGDDGDIKLFYSDDNSAWDAGVAHSLKAGSIQRIDVPSGGRYVKVLSQVRVSISVVSISPMNFVELGHEAL